MTASKKNTPQKFDDNAESPPLRREEVAPLSSAVTGRIPGTDEPLREGPSGIGRKRVKLLEGAAIPLGIMWTGRRTQSDGRPIEGLRWFVELRLGLLPYACQTRSLVWDPETGAPLVDTATGKVVTQVRRHGGLIEPKDGTAAGHGPAEGGASSEPVLLAPVLALRPCLHRIQRPGVVAKAFSEWRNRKPTRLELREVWALGRDGRLAENRVPATGDLFDEPGELALQTFDKALAYADTVATAGTGAKEARLAIRRILERSPALMLSPAAHPAYYLDGVEERTGAAAASLNAIGELSDQMQRRGRPHEVELPDEAVDLFQNFPISHFDARSVDRGEKTRAEFVAMLALQPGDRANPDALAERTARLRADAEHWRSRERNGKGADPKLILFIDGGHLLVEGEEWSRDYQVQLDLLARWLRADFLAQSLALLEENPRIEFVRNGFLREGSYSVDVAQPLVRAWIRFERSDLNTYVTALRMGAGVRDLGDQYAETTVEAFSESPAELMAAIEGLGLPVDSLRFDMS